VIEKRGCTSRLENSYQLSSQ